MLTLDEAIEHCKEVAQAQEENCEHAGYDHYTKLKASACASEHRQLAEWLTELKERREKDVSDTKVGDTISRQEILRGFEEMCSCTDYGWDERDFRDLIKKVPSTQPEIIRYKDCGYGEQDEVGRWFCGSLGCQIGNEDGSGFCADAERRTDD